MFRLKARIRKYKSDRFLKKHGCDTYRQYNRRYDPDYSYRANRVIDSYFGYQHIYCFPNKHYAYETLYDYGPGGYRDGYHEIVEWCEKHCKHKFRFDFKRVLQNYWGEWENNEIGGGDYLFVAFKDERDYLHFMLRWS